MPDSFATALTCIVVERSRYFALAIFRCNRYCLIVVPVLFLKIEDQEHLKSILQYYSRLNLEKLDYTIQLFHLFQKLLYYLQQLQELDFEELISFCEGSAGQL